MNDTTTTDARRFQITDGGGSATCVACKKSCDYSWRANDRKTDRKVSVCQTCSAISI